MIKGAKIGLQMMRLLMAKLKMTRSDREVNGACNLQSDMPCDGSHMDRMFGSNTLLIPQANLMHFCLVKIYRPQAI